MELRIAPETPGGNITCPEENDLIFQGQVREVGDSLGPLNKCEELLVSCMAYVGNRVICLIKSNIKGKRGKENLSMKIFDSHCLYCTWYQIK